MVDSPGKRSLRNALKDPQSLAEDISEDEAGDGAFQNMLSVSYDAYKLKTGKAWFL